MNDTSELGTHVLSAVTNEFTKMKQQCDGAIAQLTDEQLFFQLNKDQNSIYVIMKHLAGNMLSRWTNFRTTDGEKPDRNRDEEFIERRVPRDEIMAHWERGWACFFNALKSIKPDELQRDVFIRGQRHSLFEAINRQTAHYGYHAGQIVLLAKHVRGSAWNYLTIPRGQSQQFNEQMQRTKQS